MQPQDTCGKHSGKSILRQMVPFPRAGDCVNKVFPQLGMGDLEQALPDLIPPQKYGIGSTEELVRTWNRRNSCVEYRNE